MKRILVIGGSNIDYVAKSISPLIKNDSNIGKISISNGGVGRNIALNLALLGNKVTFITGLGKDYSSLAFKKELNQFQVKTLIPKSEYGIGSYLAINDNLGEMSLAICDSSFCDHLTFSSLKPFKNKIETFNDIVLDANINEKLIIDIVSNFKEKRFYVDGVSANKVSRFRQVFNKIHLFKSNLIEAQQITNSQLEGKELVKKLLDYGAKIVIITNSSKSIYFGYNNIIKETPPPKINSAEIVNVNGAGDAFFAGFVSSYLETNNVVSSIEEAKQMSYYTLKSSSSVNKEIKTILKK